MARVGMADAFRLATICLVIGLPAGPNAPGSPSRMAPLLYNQVSFM